MNKFDYKNLIVPFMDNPYSIGLNNTMNIHSKKGDKIIVTEESIKNGFENSYSRTLLEVGKIYTVESIKIDNYNTHVFLQEIPKIGFNSVNFEDYEEFFGKLYDNTENLKMEAERTLRFSNKLYTIDSSQAIDQNSMHEEPQQDIMNTLNEHVETLSAILLNLKAANENFKLVMGE